MKALKILNPGHAGVVDTPVPKLPSPEYLLIKTIAIALNPADVGHIEWVTTQATVGCDYAGVVEEVGSDVTQPFKKGDRVWGCVHGGNQSNPEGGAFAEYLVANSNLVLKIPEGLTFEQMATAGAGIVTVGQGLYQAMPLPWPDNPLKEKVPILIYGGSTASGALGIQFAKLSGFEVITTCSPGNFDYVKSLGADAVFDYNSPTCGADIRKYTNGKLYYVWDTIGANGSFEIGAAALPDSAPPGQKLYYGNILSPDNKTREDVVFTHTFGYTARGQPFEYKGFQVPAIPEHYEFMKKWLEFAEKLLNEGKWKPHRPEVREGGLDGILSGLDDLKNHKVSGVKLVYRIGEP